MKPLLRFVGVVAGLAMACVAQALFERYIKWQFSYQQFLAIGGLGLLLGGLLFGVAVPRPSCPEPQPVKFALPSPLILALAVGSYATSMVLYRRDGEWAGVHVAWALGAILFLAACWQPAKQPPPTSLARRASWWAAWLTLLALAAAVRVWRLDTLPPQLTAETVGAAIEARRILDGTHPGIIEFGWSYIPRLGFLPEIVSLSVFSDDLFGAMMSGVLTGMASLVATYLLAAELYGGRVAWLAFGVLSFSYTHIHFSRVPPHIHPLPFVAFAVFFLMRMVRTGQAWHAALAGLTAGLAFQMYFPGRIVVVLFALVALHQLVRRKLEIRSWMLIGAGFLISLGPMAIFLLSNWDRFMDRTNATSVFNPDIMASMRAGYGGVSALEVVLIHLERSFLAFSYFKNAWFERELGRAFLDPFSGPLLALGFGYCLVGLRRIANWLVATAFVAIVVIGVALTTSPPFWQRMTVVMPLVAILIALPIDRLARLAPVPRAVTASILAVVVGGIGWWNWTYFVAHESKRASALATTARFAAAQPADRPLVIVTLPWQPVFDEYVYFMARDHPRVIVTPEDARAGRWPEVREPLTVIFTPHYVDLLQMVRMRWPNGAARELKLPDGSIALHVYETS